MFFEISIFILLYLLFIFLVHLFLIVFFYWFLLAGYPGTSSSKTSSGESWLQPTCLAEAWTSSGSTSFSTTTCQRILTRTSTESVHPLFRSLLIYAGGRWRRELLLNPNCFSTLGCPCRPVWNQRPGRHLCVRRDGCKDPERRPRPLWSQRSRAARGDWHLLLQ